MSMKFTKNTSDFFVPDSSPMPRAAGRVTHLCVGAHQDDIEIMAFHGVKTCFGQADKWFGGVVVTDGGGSPRTGKFASMTDGDMKRVRLEEQREAARIGQYAFVAQLGYPSAEVKDRENKNVAADLKKIFEASGAEVVYLHQPFDKHETHIATLGHCLRALVELPEERRPKLVLGCEVWRDLDWLDDTRKVPLDVGGMDELASRLLCVFESQVAGGKRYDLGAMGRRAANATFAQSHGVDKAEGVTFAIELTDLVRGKEVGSVKEFVEKALGELAADVRRKTEKHL